MRSDTINLKQKNINWITGEMLTSKGNIKTVSTNLELKDILGAVKSRFGIGRMNYKIKPELYAVGSPDENSPVLVSANYKLTFDSLRKELNGLNCFLLILDTKGINVWCAAGKGTFSTNELLDKIEKTNLKEIVAHRTLILPELGASGVSAHIIKKETGFSVAYGPVYASDIKEFIKSGLKAEEKMRRVHFNLKDRIVLVPMEFIPAAKISIFVFGILFLLNMFSKYKFGFNDFFIYFASVITGTVLTPILLPYIPFRAFSFKGFLLGIVSTVLIAFKLKWFSPPFLLLGIGYTLILPAYSAFLAMNFTGSSTYTSFSGVIKEMKIAVPIMIISSFFGFILILIKVFLG